MNCPLGRCKYVNLQYDKTLTFCFRLIRPIWSPKFRSWQKTPRWFITKGSNRKKNFIIPYFYKYIFHHVDFFLYDTGARSYIFHMLVLLYSDVIFCIYILDWNIVYKLYQVVLVLWIYNNGSSTNQCCVKCVYFFVFTARKPWRKYSDASSNDCPVTIQASISISPKKNFQRFRIVTRTILFAITVNKWIVS